MNFFVNRQFGAGASPAEGQWGQCPPDFRFCPPDLFLAPAAVFFGEKKVAGFGRKKRLNL